MLKTVDNYCCYYYCYYYYLYFFFFSGATTLYGSWRPQPQAQTPTWKTRDYTLSGPYCLTCLAWAALPGAYAPASIVLLLFGARRSPLEGKAVVLEADYYYYYYYYYCYY
jgi:hypothetical protein